jgi:ATP phosphoribosyltransferase regulatory subunit
VFFLGYTLKDYLKLAEIGNRLRGVFNLWNYREVVFPAIEEYSESIRKGTKFAYNNGFYVICPDATSRIMKMFENGEGRFYYISEVLDGDIRGVWEAGVELIGGREPDMYVEILSVLITALESLGIQDFYIDIGSIKVWDEATSGIEPFREDIRKALLTRNFGIIESLPISTGRKRSLWELFNFRGKRSGVEKLDKIVELLGDDRVFLDFGTVRPLPYYTDVIFEVYSPRLGKPLGGGGEYTVGEKRGIGFALNLGALSKLYRERRRGGQVIRGETGEAYRKARELVKMGIPVEVRP